MRVIAGRLRGRRLDPPSWKGLRPSSDRLRETLFNVLGPMGESARVLDLCAGTGAVGIEALSRGARHVTFVDADPRACRLIARNLAACGVTGGYTIVPAGIDEAIGGLPGDFDLVFLDPPYADPGFERWLPLAASQVADNGVLVVEHARRRVPGPSAGSLPRTRTLASGDSALSFYRRPAGMPVGTAAG
jgi:16S rRNA (guanine(966)-N(2))-methyltransferase RsmD